MSAVPTYALTQALDLLWDVYHLALHTVDAGKEEGGGVVAVCQGDVDKLNAALDEFENAFPMARHGHSRAREALHRAALVEISIESMDTGDSAGEEAMAELIRQSQELETGYDERDAQRSAHSSKR